jgi:hypothetical protein
MVANTHRHDRYRPAPTAIKATAGHSAGLGLALPPVRISQGNSTAPEPGTTIVKARFRSARLMVTSMPLLARSALGVTSAEGPWAHARAAALGHGGEGEQGQLPALLDKRGGGQSREG